MKQTRPYDKGVQWKKVVYYDKKTDETKVYDLNEKERITTWKKNKKRRLKDIYPVPKEGSNAPQIQLNIQINTAPNNTQTNQLTFNNDFTFYNNDTYNYDGYFDNDDNYPFYDENLLSDFDEKQFDNMFKDE